MGESKYTKGPWEASSRMGNGYRVHGKQGLGDGIADIFDRDTTDETIENTTLISAAPDLLEACNLFMEKYEFMLDINVNIRAKAIHDVLHEIKHAIAEAEGR